MSAQLLTPQINYTTGPILAPATENGPARSAVINICSEFMAYPTPLTSIQASGRVEIIQLNTGEPMIFSLNPSRRLMVYVHIAGGPALWQPIDITPVAPGKGHVNVFDLMQSDSTHVKIAVSVQQPDATCDMYFASWTLPQLTWDDTKKVILGSTAVPWKAQKNNLGRLNISAISLTHSKDFSGNYVYSHVVVGTNATAQKTAMHYNVDITTGAAAAPFSPFTFAGTADKVLDISAGNAYPIGEGVFSLWQAPGTTVGSTDGGLACKFDTLDGTRHYNIQISQLGQVSRIEAHFNVYGTTDLFAASEKGLAYYSYKALDQPPVMILPGTGFMNVSSSETRVSPSQSKVVVFALSSHYELYYIEGTRNTKTGVLSFSTSGFPIRQNVEQISAQYNAATNASEVIYLGNGRDEVFHLWRDPTGVSWNEQQIMIQSDGTIQNVNSFITSIVIKDDAGASLSDIPCLLTSEMAFVTVNDRAHVLDSRPTKFSLDQTGKLTIIQSAPPNLNAIHYTLSLPAKDGSTTPFSCEIIPSQRIIRQLATIQSGDDVKNAVNSRGETVFAGLGKSDSDFELAGDVGSNFKDFILSVSGNGPTRDAANKILDSASSTVKDITVAWEKGSDGKVRKTDTDWLDQAIDGAETLICDALECWRAVYKAEVKLALKIAGPLVRLYIQIEAKIIHFALEHIGPVICSVITFFGDLFGIDTSAVVAWLSLLFDNGKTLQTQKTLLMLTSNAMTTCQRFCKVNSTALATLTDEFVDELKSVIPDARPPPVQDSTVANIPNPLSWLLDNPIVSALWRYCPLDVILECLGEEIGSQIQIPDTSALANIVGRVLPNLAGEEFDNALRGLEGVFEAIRDWITGAKSLDVVMKEIMSDAFWTMFDAVKLLFVALLDVMAGVVDQIIALVKGRWVIPIITDIWEEFTGCQFTIENVVTFVVALGMNLYSLTVHKSLPFDNWAVPATTMLFSEQELDLARAWKVAKGQAVGPAQRKAAVRVAGKPQMREVVPSGFMQGGDDHMSDDMQKVRMVDSICGITSRCLNVLTVIVECLDLVVPYDEEGRNFPADLPAVRVPKNIQALSAFSAKPRQWLLGEDQRSKVQAFLDGAQVLCNLTSFAGHIAFAGYHGENRGGTIAPAIVVKFASFLIRVVTPFRIKKPGYGYLFTTAGIASSVVDNVCYDLVQEYILGPDKSTRRSQFMLAASMLELGSCALSGGAMICAQYVRTNPDLEFAVLGLHGMDIICQFGGITQVSLAFSEKYT